MDSREQQEREKREKEKRLEEQKEREIRERLILYAYRTTDKYIHERAQIYSNYNKKKLLRKLALKRGLLAAVNNDQRLLVTSSPDVEFVAGPSGLNDAEALSLSPQTICLSDSDDDDTCAVRQHESSAEQDGTKKTNNTTPPSTLSPISQPSSPAPDNQASSNVPLIEDSGVLNTAQTDASTNELRSSNPLDLSASAVSDATTQTATVTCNVDQSDSSISHGSSNNYHVPLPSLSRSNLTRPLRIHEQDSSNQQIPPQPNSGAPRGISGNTGRHSIAEPRDVVPVNHSSDQQMPPQPNSGDPRGINGNTGRHSIVEPRDVVPVNHSSDQQMPPQPNSGDPRGINGNTGLASRIASGPRHSISSSRRRSVAVSSDDVPVNRLASRIASGPHHSISSSRRRSVAVSSDDVPVNRLASRIASGPHHSISSSRRHSIAEPEDVPVNHLASQIASGPRHSFSNYHSSDQQMPPQPSLGNPRFRVYMANTAPVVPPVAQCNYFDQQEAPAPLASSPQSQQPFQEPGPSNQHVPTYTENIAPPMFYEPARTLPTRSMEPPPAGFQSFQEPPLSAGNPFQEQEETSRELPSERLQLPTGPQVFEEYANNILSTMSALLSQGQVPMSAPRNYFSTNNAPPVFSSVPQRPENTYTQEPPQSVLNQYQETSEFSRRTESHTRPLMQDAPPVFSSAPQRPANPYTQEPSQSVLNQYQETSEFSRRNAPYTRPFTHDVPPVFSSAPQRPADPYTQEPPQSVINQYQETSEFSRRNAPYTRPFVHDAVPHPYFTRNRVRAAGNVVRPPAMRDQMEYAEYMHNNSAAPPQGNWCAPQASMNYNAPTANCTHTQQQSALQPHSSGYNNGGLQYQNYNSYDVMAAGLMPPPPPPLQHICRHCQKICKSGAGLKIHLRRTCEKHLYTYR